MSPFGCRRGFHLIIFGNPSRKDIAKALKTVLERITTRTTWENVQGVSSI